MEKKIFEKLKGLVSSETTGQDSTAASETRREGSPLKETAEDKTEERLSITKSLDATQQILQRTSKAIEDASGQITRLNSAFEQIIRILDTIQRYHKEQLEELSNIKEQLSFGERSDKVLLDTLDNLSRNVASLARIAENLKDTQEQFSSSTEKAFEGLLKSLRVQSITVAVIIILGFGLLAAFMWFAFLAGR